MPEASFEDRGSGLAPASDGWFVVNVRDAQWLSSENGELKPSGSECVFESREFWFRQLGVRLHVLEPGEPNGLYHSETVQEAFLVLSGEARLLVEGEERILRPWDFFHCPPGTEHIFVGAGDGPCVIFMVGARVGGRGAALPGLRARGAVRRERRDGDVQSGRGVPGRLRAVAPRAAVVLVAPALGLAVEPGDQLGRREIRERVEHEIRLVEPE